MGYGDLGTLYLFVHNQLGSPTSSTSKFLLLGSEAVMSSHHAVSKEHDRRILKCGQLGQSHNYHAKALHAVTHT